MAVPVKAHAANRAAHRLGRRAFNRLLTDRREGLYSDFRRPAPVKRTLRNVDDLSRLLKERTETVRPRDADPLFG
jgi:hypothetical protein